MDAMPERLDAARAELIANAERIGASAISEFAPLDDGRNELTLEVSVGNAPVRLRAVLPIAHPFGEIEVFVEASEWRRFAHQNADGKICPPPEAVSARDDSRLVQAVEAAGNWLREAALGTLTVDSERYELPEFPIRKHDWRFLFDEEAANHASWASYLGGTGEVLLAQHAAGWAAEWYRSSSGIAIAKRSSIREPSDATRVSARWVLVNGFSATGHRVSRNWDDLRAVFPALDDALFRAWYESTAGFAVLLVGSPMRATWGGTPERVHWQPIIVESFKSARAKAKASLRNNGRSCKGKHLAPRVQWRQSGPMATLRDIPWGCSEDVSRDRLYARTSPVSRAFVSPIVIGCGAIGSAIADYLVRDGLARIAVVDKDILEYGNLCRHVLNGAAVGTAKAKALEAHLRLVSPSVDAHGICATLPPMRQKDEDDFRQSLLRADLVIDASGDDEVLEWLGGIECNAQLVSVWTNSDASIGVCVLAGCSQGRLSLAELRAHVRESIDAGAVPGVSAIDFLGPAPIVPGTGCWHPTFRGGWNRVAALSAAASEWLGAAARGANDGRAVVFRFREGGWQKARGWRIPVPSPFARAG